MTLENMAALKAATPSTTDIATIKGYHTAGDGGGGDFYWDSSATEADNQGTIIESTTTSTGRWKRIYPEGSINVKWFGAQTGTLTDQSAAFNKAIQALSASGGELFIPAGAYELYGGITLVSNLTINGPGAILKGNMAGIDVHHVVIRPGLTMQQNNGSHVIFFNGAQTSSIRISGINIEGKLNTGFSSDGILFYQCGKEFWVEDCRISGINRIGITVDTCAGEAYIQNNNLSTCRNGIHIEGSSDVICSGNILDDCGNSSYGSAVHPYFSPIVFSHANNLRFTANTFRNNTRTIDIQICPCDNVTFSDNIGLPSVVTHSIGSSIYVSNMTFRNNTGGGLIPDQDGIDFRGRFIFENNSQFGGINISGFQHVLVKNNTNTTAPFDIRALSTLANSYLEVTGNVHTCQYYGVLQSDIVLFCNNSFSASYHSGYPGYVGYRFYGPGKVVARDNRSSGITGYHFWFDDPNADITVDNNTLLGITVMNTGNPAYPATADLHIKQKPDIYQMSAAPTSGTFKRDDIVFNTAPSAGSPSGWVCTAAGTPGTWSALSTL